MTRIARRRLKLGNQPSCRANAHMVSKRDGRIEDVGRRSERMKTNTTKRGGGDDSGEAGEQE